MNKKIFGLLAGIVILALAILACGSSDNVGQATTAPDNAPTTQHFQLGDHVKVGNDWNITVNKVTTSAGNDILQPKPGNLYLVITVTVNNISNKEQNISSLVNFSLKGAETGKKYEQSLGGSDNASLDGKVEAGGKMQGDLTYEVAAKERTFNLAFENQILSSGQAIWDLKI